jgi:hypothetical protein
VFLDQRGYRALITRCLGVLAALLACGALVMIVLAATDFSRVAGVPLAGQPVILARVHGPPSLAPFPRMRRGTDPDLRALHRPHAALPRPPGRA